LYFFSNFFKLIFFFSFLNYFHSPLIPRPLWRELGAD
jgi:hypothetical protein